MKSSGHPGFPWGFPVGTLRPFRYGKAQQVSAALRSRAFRISTLVLLALYLFIRPILTDVAIPFTSPPASQSHSFSFIGYGDVQGNYQRGHDSLVGRMLQEPAALVFHSGDISPDQGRHYERHFYPSIEKLARRIPFFPAAGNHDIAWGSSFSRQGFRSFFRETFAYLGKQTRNSHLRKAKSQKLWYSLVYGTSLFIVMDSNFFIHSGKYQRTHALEPYRNYARELLLWIRQLLKEASRDTHIQAKFVFFHHSPLVTEQTQTILWFGGHQGHRQMVVSQVVPGSDKENQLYLLDLFRYHGVTAVFTGHEHYYERWREVIREKGRPVYTLNWVVNGLEESNLAALRSIEKIKSKKFSTRMILSGVMSSALPH